MAGTPAVIATVGTATAGVTAAATAVVMGAAATENHAHLFAENANPQDSG
jgi:hypothetical protein